MADLRRALDAEDGDGCARLWAMVLLLGLDDARRGKEPDWIGSDDFAEVASLAGVDPEPILEAFRSDSRVMGSFPEVVKC